MLRRPRLEVMQPCLPPGRRSWVPVPVLETGRPPSDHPGL
jgi:hypothetical protein